MFFSCLQMERTVQLCNYVQLDFRGPAAIAFGDVDQDGDCELVLGSMDGQLALFRGLSTSPYRECSGLGSIVCLVIGDIRRHGQV